MVHFLRVKATVLAIFCSQVFFPFFEPCKIDSVLALDVSVISINHSFFGLLLVLVEGVVKLIIPHKGNYGKHD
jgi:hypothetical protein